MELKKAKNNLDISIPDESLEISDIPNISENHGYDLILENSNFDTIQLTEQIKKDISVVENQVQSNEEVQNYNAKIQELRAKYDENLSTINDLKEKLKESEEKFTQSYANSQRMQNEFQERITQLNSTINNGNSYVQKLKQ